MHYEFQFHRSIPEICGLVWPEQHHLFEGFARVTDEVSPVKGFVFFNVEAGGVAHPRFGVSGEVAHLLFRRQVEKLSPHSHLVFHRGF